MIFSSLFFLHLYFALHFSTCNKLHVFLVDNSAPQRAVKPRAHMHSCKGVRILTRRVRGMLLPHLALALDVVSFGVVCAVRSDGRLLGQTEFCLRRELRSSSSERIRTGRSKSPASASIRADIRLQTNRRETSTKATEHIDAEKRPVSHTQR